MEVAKRQWLNDQKLLVLTWQLEIQSGVKSHWKCKRGTAAEGGALSSGAPGKILQHTSLPVHWEVFSCRQRNMKQKRVAMPRNASLWIRIT